MPWGNRREKLTDDEVRQLMALRGTITQVEAARRFGITQAAVSWFWLGKPARLRRLGLVPQTRDDS